LGAVNGLGQSLASLSRSIGPAVGGVLWSLSVHYHFVFLNFMVVSLLLGGCNYINRCLPLSLDEKKQSSSSPSASEKPEEFSISH